METTRSENGQVLASAGADQSTSTVESSFIALIQQVWNEKDSSDQTVLETLQNILNKPTAEKGKQDLKQFQIKRMIGEGGFGTVYEGFDQKLGRQVAIKVPKLERLLVPRYRKLFLREAESAAALDHPNIVAIHEIVDGDPIPFIVSLYIQGPSLEQLLRDERWPTQTETVDWLLQLAKAVQHAHERGIIHRDIKPGNILLDPGTLVDGRQQWKPKLTDFGLAKSIHALEENDKTKTGEILGTPEYMAPEQAAGKSQDIGIGTDIYALGVVLFRLLTHKLPFTGLNRAEILHNVISNEAPGVRPWMPEVPLDLEAICLKCLAKAPADRYRSAYELVEDLQAFQSGQPTKARPLNSGERLVRLIKRHPAIAALLAGLVLLMVIFGIEKFRYERGLSEAYSSIKQRADELARVVYAYTIKQTNDLLLRGRQASALERLNSLKQSDLISLRGLEWRLLQHEILSRNPYYLLGHESGTSTLIADEKGQSLISVSLSSPLKLWDLSDGSSRDVLEQGEKLWYFLDPGTNLTWNALVSEWGNVYIWSNKHPTVPIKRMFFPTLNEILRSKRQTGKPAGSLDGRYLVQGIDQQGILVMDLNSGQERLLEGGNWNAADVGHLEFCYIHPSHQWLVGRHTKVKAKKQIDRFFVWDLKAGQCVGEITDLPGMQFGLVSFSSSSDTVWLGNYGGDVFGVNLKTRRVDRHIKNILRQSRDYSEATGTPPSPASLDNDRWIIARDTGDVVELDLTTGTERTLTRMQSPFMNMQRISPDELLVWNKAELVYLRISTAEVLQRIAIPGELQINNGESFLYVGSYLKQYHAMALSGRDGRIAILKLKAQPPVVPLRSNTLNETWTASFSPDSKLMTTGGDHGQMKLWDTSSRTLLRSFKGNLSLITSVAFSPDGKWLVSGGYDKDVRVWSVDTGDCVKVLNGHTQEITCVAWSPCGRFVAAGAKRDKKLPFHNSRILVWEVETERVVLDGAWHDDSVRCLAFHADGVRLFTGSEDRNIVEANWRTGKTLRTFLEPGEVWSLEARGDTLLAVGKERSASLRNLHTGQLKRKWYDPQTSIRSHAWTPDGRTIVTGGEQGPIRLWQTATGLELCTVDTGTSKVLGLAVSPDGNHLAATCHDGKTYLWSLPATK